MGAQYSDKGRAVTQLILEIFRLNGRLLTKGDRLVAPLGQTSSRWQVLGALEDGETTVPSIGRKMGISRQSVQRTADILVRQKLCQFVENPDHQKSPLVALTPKGKETLCRIGEVQIKWANGLSVDLNAKEIATAVKLLENLANRLS